MSDDTSSVAVTTPLEAVSRFFSVREIVLALSPPAMPATFWLAVSMLAMMAGVRVASSLVRSDTDDNASRPSTSSTERKVPSNGAKWLWAIAVNWSAVLLMSAMILAAFIDRISEPTGRGLPIPARICTALADRSDTAEISAILSSGIDHPFSTLRLMRNCMPSSEAMGSTSSTAPMI